MGIVAANELRIGDERVVGPREAAVANPAGGTVIDSEAREAIAQLLDAMRSHGLIAS